MKIFTRLLFFLTLGFLGLVLWAGFNKDNTAASTSEFTTITGNKLALKDLRGKPVLVTFWATTCGKCMEEIPHLVGLYERFHPKGFEIIAVAVSYDPPNQVVAMAKNKNLPYPISLDIDGKHEADFGGIWGTPTTYLIDKDGKISWDTVGQFEPRELSERIEKQLQG